MRFIYRFGSSGSVYTDSGAFGALYLTVLVYDHGWTVIGTAVGRLQCFGIRTVGTDGCAGIHTGGGPGYVFQPTFGYLLGFIAGTWLTGKIAWAKAEPDVKWLLLATVAGLLVVYCSGTAYCYWISNFVLGNTLTFWPLMVTCFFLPLPGDLALCVVSALLGKRLIPHLRQYQSR